MGSVTSLPGGLAYLTQPGGLLSTLSSAISTSELQSASPEDLVSLSLAALQAQETDGLFGVSPANQGTAGLPWSANDPAGDSNEGSILSGIASADLTNATPQEKAEISNQTVRFQQAEALFNPPPATSPGFNLIA
jgi:hypothetical protein